jgi:UDP-2,4-diacetamido-2,4,6-trideoxy-beta-L-altropyranose hydrolase
MPERILIRADGSPRTGTGHVMRCLALAQGWQRTGGQAIFAQAETTPALQERLSGEGLEVVRLKVAPGTEEDAGQTAIEARSNAVTAVVADGYVFGALWQRRIKDAGFRLLLVDDFAHAEHYSADWVLNQNLNADPALYARREPHTQLLLGTRYALLRRDFLAWSKWQREYPPPARRVLVTLGGSDPDNVTGKVIDALGHLRDWDAVVVVGGSNPNLAALQAARAPSQCGLRLVVDARNMPQLMAETDVAVAAAGTTSWELAFMGLPALTLVLADNQRANAEYLHAAGLSRNLGWHSQVSPESLARQLEALRTDALARTEMSRRGRATVDGAGAERVAAILRAS